MRSLRTRASDTSSCFRLLLRGVLLFLLYLLPLFSCNRCGGLLLLGCVLHRNIALFCDLGRGKNPPPSKTSPSSPRNPKFQTDTKHTLTLTLILSPSAQAPTHTAHTTHPLLLSLVTDTFLLIESSSEFARLLPPCCRCSSLATTVGVCYALAMFYTEIPHFFQ